MYYINKYYVQIDQKDETFLQNTTQRPWLHKTMKKSKDKSRGIVKYLES